MIAGKTNILKLHFNMRGAAYHWLIVNGETRHSLFYDEGRDTVTPAVGSVTAVTTKKSENSPSEIKCFDRSGPSPHRTVLPLSLSPASDTSGSVKATENVLSPVTAGNRRSASVFRWPPAGFHRHCQKRV